MIVKGGGGTEIVDGTGFVCDRRGLVAARRSRGLACITPQPRRQRPGANDDGRLGPFVKPFNSDLERRQEVELLKRAMAVLPVDARELIVLRFIEEMPYGEIARTVGASEASLRGKVFRSLKMLRDALERKGVAHAM